MPVPTSRATWQIPKNIVVPALGETLAIVTLRIIQAALAAAFAQTGGPTVVGSSNGTTAAMDAVNRWATGIDPSTLAWGAEGSPRSWLLLSMPGVVTGFQVLFVLCNVDVGDGSPGLMQVYTATGGFTGGDAHHRPTAADEVRALADPSDATLGAAMLFETGSLDMSTTGAILTVWVPTDGSSLRVIAWAAGIPIMVWLIEKPLAPTTDWTAPYAAHIGPGRTSRQNGSNTATNRNFLTYDVLWWPDAGLVGPSAPGGRGSDGVQYGEVEGGITLGLTGEGIGGQAIGQVMTGLDAITQGAPVLPMGLFTSKVIAGSSPGPYDFTGRRGVLSDMYWGSVTPVTGSTYPDDATRQWIQIDHTIHPWDGSAVLSTSAP